MDCGFTRRCSPPAPKISGCTVHFVDNEYDHGPIVLQRKVEVRGDDTPQTLQARVFAAECEAYPAALRQLAERRMTDFCHSMLAI